MQNIILKNEELGFRSREAFKTLRSNVELSGDDVQVICVTSIADNDGRTVCSYELANAFAESGRKTLLVDADLRGSQMRLYGKSGTVRYGLTNYLAGLIELDSCICRTDRSNLDIIFAGPTPPNPMELFFSKWFAAMIEKTRGLYDYVIIDTPPLGPVIDAIVVGRQCDGVLMIMEAGAVSHRIARRAKEQLDASGVRIIGCVLNNVTASSRGGKYYANDYGDLYGKERGR